MKWFRQQLSALRLFTILTCVAAALCRADADANDSMRRSLLQEDEALRLARLAREGSDSVLTDFLATGVDPDLRFNGTPPIWRAAFGENLPAVRVLIDAGANVNATNRNGTTALYIASQSGYAEIVDALLEAGADPNVRSIWGSTALSAAVVNDKEQVMEQLIVGGAEMEIATEETQQSMLWMAASRGTPEIVRVLLVQGMDVNQADASGATPLYAAAAAGHRAVVELLLAEVADPDIARLDGNTPLHVAAANCSVGIVRSLVGVGASTELRNADGRRPLELACVQHEEAVQRRLRVEGVLAPLIEAARRNNQSGVQALIGMKNIDEQVRSGKSALIYAARNGNEAIIEILREAGADPDLRDISNWTALHHAANAQSAIAVVALDEADTEALNNESHTPLMVAVRRSDADVATVRTLIELGADVNTRSEASGDTALHIAARYGNATIIRELASSGARLFVRNTAGERPRSVIGDATDLTDEEIVELRRIFSRSSGMSETSGESASIERSGAPRRIDPNTVTRSNPGDPVANIQRAGDDDDDTFETGEIVAFLLVPAAVVALCMAALVLYFRRSPRRTEEAVQKKAKVETEPLTELFPEFGKPRAVEVGPHFRQSDRDFEVPVPLPPIPKRVEVSLFPNQTAVDVQLDVLEAHQEITPEGSDGQVILGRPVVPARHRGIEITPEFPVELPRPTEGVVDETPRFALLSKPRTTSESDEFHDAKEKFSTSGSIISSMKSDEFKDALEQPELSSVSSEKVSSSYYSAEEGGASSSEQRGTTAIITSPDSGNVQHIAAVESFALESLGTTESRGVSTDSQAPTHARTLSSSEPSLDPVQQVAPDAPVRLESFMIHSMSDTASIDSASLTPPTSRNVSLEMEGGQGTETGGPVRVQATGETTEEQPVDVQPREIPNFALRSFGSAFSESSRGPVTDSASFSFDRPSTERPASPQAHRVSIMSSRTSTESYGPDRTTTSEEQQPPPAENRPGSIEAHRISIMSSRTSTESYGPDRTTTSEEQQPPPAENRPGSIEAHRLSIMSSQSSIDSFGPAPPSS